MQCAANNKWAREKPGDQGLGVNNTAESTRQTSSTPFQGPVELRREVRVTYEFGIIRQSRNLCQKGVLFFLFVF